jgi:hypothetical protein
MNMSKEKTKTSSAINEKVTFAFGKENYRLMIIGVAVIAVGMILMMGGASPDAHVMSEGIFNFQRLTLAPIVIVGGYVVVLLSILKKSKSAE